MLMLPNINFLDQSAKVPDKKRDQLWLRYKSVWNGKVVIGKTILRLFAALFRLAVDSFDWVLTFHMHMIAL